MDGTENKQDTTATSTLPAASDDKQGTSKETPQTFTMEQVKAMQEKAVNDYASRTGRKEENLTKREKAIQEAEAQRQKEAEDKELAFLTDATKDNPKEMQTLLDWKKAQADKVRAYNAERAEVQPLIDVIKELGFNNAESLRQTLTHAKAAEFESLVNKVASENNVDAVALKDGAEEMGLKDEAKIKKLATSMPKKTVVSNLDSGKTTGGTKELTQGEKLKLRYPTMK
jgi:hypothetical protein